MPSKQKLLPTPVEPRVVALSPDLAQAAARLAAACGARFATCDPQEEPVGALAVLLLACDWTAAALRRIHAAMAKDTSTVPGLLIARDRADAERQVDAWLGAGRQTPAPLARVLEFRITESGTVRPNGPGMLVGGRAIPSPILRALLGAGAEVVRIATHGDGLDSSLGQAGVLCSLVGRLPGIGGPQPPCVGRRHCHRLDVPLDEALGGDTLVAPQAIRARVVVLDTCSGLHLGNSTFDAALSLAMAFTAADEPPIVITRAGFGLGNARSDEGLIEDLRQGLSVGEAVARYNATPQARALDRRYLILGNPRVHVAAASLVGGSTGTAPAPGSPEFALLQTAEGPLQPAHCSPRRRLMWLATLARRGLGSSAAARIEPARKRALQAAADALGRTALRDDGSVQRRTVEPLGRSLLTLIPLLGRHALTDLWEEEAVMRLFSRGDCQACGGEESRFFCRIAKGEDRMLAVCQACGITEDRPAASRRLPLFQVTREGWLGPLSAPSAGSRALSLYAYDERPAAIVTLTGHRGFRCLPRPQAEGPVQLGLWEYAAGSLAVWYRRVYVRLPGDGTARWLRPSDTRLG